MPDDSNGIELLEQRPKFGILLDTARQVRLRDAALKIFSASSHSEDMTLERLVTTAVTRLDQALQCPAGDLEQNVQAQADSCHGAWVICSALIAASPSVLASATAKLPAEQGRRLIDQVAFMIGALCLEGPATLRPALLSCIGLLVQGRGHFFALHPCLLECLRAALRSSSRALRGRAVEAVIEMLSNPSNATDTSISRQLVALHPEFVNLLATETSEPILMQTLAAFESLSSFGLTDPHSALPYVLVECLSPVSLPSRIAAAQRCLLRIVSDCPEAFHKSLPSALRRFKEVSVQWDIVPGDILRSSCNTSLPMASFFASLREQLQDDLLQRCGVVLRTELRDLQQLDLDSSCAMGVGEVVFLLVEGLHISRSVVVQETCRVAKYPTLASCVEVLVSAAIQELASTSTASVDSSSDYVGVSSKLADALTDLEEFDLPTEGDVTRLLAYHWPKGEKCSTVVNANGSSEATSTVEKPSDCEKHGNLEKPIDIEKTQPSSEIPWFATYDATCDKWRCSICAEAGGRNPYGKGISIKKDQVALRMRIHSKAAVHRSAVEAKKDASSSSTVLPSEATRHRHIESDASEQTVKRRRTQQSALGGA